MKKTILKLAALLAVPLLLLVAAQAQSQTVTSSIKILLPEEGLLVEACPGEVVKLTGTIHIVLHTTINSDGSFHMQEHFNPQGVSGVGLPSGRKYQGTGATQTNTNTDAPFPFDPFPFEMTHVNNFNVVGQGPGNNFMVHANTHITVNANGDMTADVDKYSGECK